MRNVLVVMTVWLLAATAGSAQSRRDTTGTAPPPGGRAILIADPAFTPNSLKELVEKADLILDGEVASVLPTRLGNPERSTSLETDSVILITKVLKGGEPPSTHRIIMSQPGGKRGGLEVVPSDDPLVEKGERYILFLTADNRPNLPDYPGMPRFYLTGAWNGKFNVRQGNIKTNPRSTAGVRGHEDLPVDAFLGRIAALAGTAAR
jgi:hypothetical protein